MPISVAQIAAKAFSGVSGAITGAIHDATLTWQVSPIPGDPSAAYDSDRGEFVSIPATATGRAVVDTVKPISDVFPDYVAGSGDELILLEGLTACEEGWKVAFNGGTWHITAVQDILAAGALFYVVGRKEKV